ncbi:MAG: TraR/DksA family transcriptional regulator [bacterium]|jgi:DnaK suppressor protein|tara:strand:+ start:258 stop:647 length:390 start_codon:yes stop_codon:yes gene_type:complete
MEEIKRLLLEEKAALLENIREKTGNQNKLQNDIGDAIDSSVEEQDRELDLLLQDRDQARLKGIENALQRMESDDFGYCDECGENISKKRLMAVPLTSMCINCQSIEERNRLAQNAFSRADYTSQVLSDE